MLSPLMKPGGEAGVVLIDLPPEGSIGEHEAVVGQLFCVVEGAGWVSGGDGARTPLRARQAAHWRRGERHAAGTEQGLTAVVLEGEAFEVGGRLLDGR